MNEICLQKFNLLRTNLKTCSVSPFKLIIVYCDSKDSSVDKLPTEEKYIKANLCKNL